MKNRYHFVFLLLFFNPWITLSQNDYFIKDHILNVGASVIDGNELTNHSVCRVKEGKTFYLQKDSTSLIE